MIRGGIWAWYCAGLGLTFGVYVGGKVIKLFESACAWLVDAVATSAAAGMLL